MIINRIPAEVFYVNNPIFVDIVDDYAKKIIITARNNSTLKEFEIVLDLYNGRAVFDMAIVGKAMLPLPSYLSTFESQGLHLNRVNVTFFFESLDENDEVISQDQRTFTFIRGGVVAGNNIYIRDGAVLTESERVPLWEGYPTMMAEIEGFEIIFRTILKPKEIEIMRTRSCNGIYFAWLNSKGGYSFWLFETWEFDVKSEGAEMIDEFRHGYNYQAFQSTGSKAKYSLNVQSTIPERYFNHIRSLIASPDIWVYKIENFVDYYGNLSPMFPPTNQTDWKRIQNPGNSFSWNSWEKTKDVSLNFDVVLTENREVLW